MIRRLATSALALSLVLAASARAETPASHEALPQSILLVQPFASTLSGGTSLSFERVLDESWAWTVGGGLFGSSFWSEDPQGSSTMSTGVTLGAGLHRYLSGHAPSGLWAGADLAARLGRSPVGLGSLGGGIPNSTSTGVSLNGLAGYTFLVERGFTVQVALGLGVDYTRFSAIDGGSNFSAPARNALVFGTRAQFGLGYAF